LQFPPLPTERHVCLDEDGLHADCDEVLSSKGEPWTLDLSDEKAEVRDAAGQVRATSTRDEAAEQFLMPSLSESIKQFRVPVDCELGYFDVAKPELKEIKAYIDRALVAAGPR
jgi:hypothetical protein